MTYEYKWHARNARRSTSWPEDVHLFIEKNSFRPEAVFFYFSGHGLQREMGVREGYLAASDTRPDKANSGLSLSWEYAMGIVIPANPARFTRKIYRITLE